MTFLPPSADRIDAPPGPVPVWTGVPDPPMERRAGETGQGRGVAPLAPQSPAPQSPALRCSRYQSLDLWRGAACMLLVCYHATFYAETQMRFSKPDTWSWDAIPLQIIRQFWCGVPIFFVISGYCIAASIESLRRRPHSFREYVVRRIRRIYPPLWIMCVLAAVYTCVLEAFPVIAQRCVQLPRLAELSPWQWLGNFLAAETWRHNVVGGEPAFLIGNTWTLCYEEQFYLVTGLMLFVAPRRFFSLAALITFAVFALRFLGLALGVTSTGFFWDGHWLLFSLGILVYQVLNHPHAANRYAAVVFVLLMIYGVAERLMAADDFHKHLGEYFFVAGAFAWFLVWMKPWDESVAAHPIFFPLRWCGQRSYSIYLTHYPLVVTVSCALALAGCTSELAVAALAVPLAVLISLPVGACFYHFVERRFLNRPLKAPRRIQA